MSAAAPLLGSKDDSGKLRWRLLPLAPLRTVLRVLEFGARKYGIDNWQHVPEARDRYYDAAMRHLTAWRDGESSDADTGESHLAHLVCCALFLIWFDGAKP